MASEQNKIENDEIEIDLRAFFLKLKNKWMYLVVSFVIGSLVALLYATFLSSPTYQATSLVYIRGNGTSISIQDLQVGSQLTKDYEIIFKSRPVLKRALDTIQANAYTGDSKEIVEDLTIKQISDSLTISNTEDTRILNLTAQAGTPEVARDIANAVMEQGISKVREIDAQEPYVIEKAIQSPVKVGMSRSKMTILGGLAGFIVMLGAIFLKFILSDYASSADDLERVLGVPVLTVVLEDSELSYKTKKTRKKQ